MGQSWNLSGWTALATLAGLAMLEGYTLPAWAGPHPSEPSPITAPVVANSSGRVSVDFVEADLGDVVKALSIQSGINAAGPAPITVPAHTVPFTTPGGLALALTLPLARPTNQPLSYTTPHLPPTALAHLQLVDVPPPHQPSPSTTTPACSGTEPQDDSQGVNNNCHDQWDVDYAQARYGTATKPAVAVTARIEGIRKDNSEAPNSRTHPCINT